jgi:hypothetical protein
MPRPYSFDHFQAKKPMQSAVGTPDRLGNDEDKQKPLKSELQETQPDTVPGANQGEIHYGMAHAETVQRLQARRAARAKKEARGTAATKRPEGARKQAKDTATAKTARTAKTDRAASEDTGTTARAKPAGKPAKPATEEHTKAATARKKTATRAQPAAEPASAPTKRATATSKKGLLGRVVSTVAKTALKTGTKGLARAAALAKEVRTSRSKPAAKPDTSSAKSGTSKKR